MLILCDIIKNSAKCSSIIWDIIILKCRRDTSVCVQVIANTGTQT